MSGGERGRDGPVWRPEGQQRFEALVHLYRKIPLGLALFDTTLRSVRLNAHLEQAIGRLSGEMLEEPLSSVIPGADAALVDGCLQVAAGARASFEAETSGPDPQHPGDERHWRVNATPYEDVAGSLAGLLVSLRDITADRRAEASLTRRLRFETFLSELSARFVNLPSAQLDQGIVDGLRELTAVIGSQWAALLVTAESGRELRVTHAHGAAESEPPVLAAEPMARLAAGSMVTVPDADDAEDGFSGGPAAIFIPLTLGGGFVGAIGLGAGERLSAWRQNLMPRVRLVGEIFVNAQQRVRAERELRAAHAEITSLKDRLEEENLYLRDEVKLQHQHQHVVGSSEAIRDALRLAEQVAATDSTVLLLGETGTGKGLLARTIHGISGRRDRPLVTVNCAALPSSLIENELFGREKGAYTGALTRQAGRFEIADGSTIFLDEVGEISADVQAKLLRVLQEGQFERLGSTRTIAVDVRMIVATNRDLPQLVRQGRFREDLLYRLNVFPIELPPLRDRREDIPLLVWYFVKQIGERMGKFIERIPQRSMHALQAYSWPGNIRELHNVLERAMILCDGNTLSIAVPTETAPAPTADLTLDEVQKRHIEAVLGQTNWRIRGERGAADLLGLKPTTLESRIKKLDIQRPAPDSDIS